MSAAVPPEDLRGAGEGALKPGVGAKDLILALIAEIGIGGGTGSVFEYTGAAIRRLSMEERMTVCNMSIEGGARAGLIAPDETTFDYLKAGRGAPQGAAWDAAVAAWRQLPTRPRRDLRSIGHAGRRCAGADDHLRHQPRHGRCRSPAACPIPPASADAVQRRALEKALAYMGLTPGEPLLGHPVDVVFIGSCTNGRLSDLRQAASVLKGRRSTPGTRVLVVPGSQQVKAQAEAEGLDTIFREAGCEWREAGVQHVHRHERRPARARPVRRQHQQPQLRGPPGAGRAHLPRQPA